MLTSKANASPAASTDEEMVTQTPLDEKVAADATARPSDDYEKPRDFPLSWKLVALVSGIMLSWGSSFSENTLGPLKSTFKKELKITNSQYGAISSATSLVNTVLPIIGGYALDYYGVEWYVLPLASPSDGSLPAGHDWRPASIFPPKTDTPPSFRGSLACSIVIFLGSVISASGSNSDEFGLIVGGRILMGFGSTLIETCTSKILAHWFQHRGLGLVYGLDVAVGKLIVLAAKSSAVPMRDVSSFWGWALWIPAITCFANLVQNVLYVWWAWTRPEWTRMPTGLQAQRDAIKRRDALEADADSPVTVSSDSRVRRFSFLPSWRNILRVPRFFWLVVCSQILQSGTVGSFSSLNADIISETRGSTDQLAGYTSSIQMVIPVVATPLVGLFFDLVGYRMMFVSITSSIWILVYCLIGYSHVNALGVMVVASFATTMNSIPFVASIPLMVPRQVELGLVFGIWKAFNNSGSVIMDMVSGRIQDITPGKTYERVVAFFVVVKGLEFCLGLFYGLLDRRYLGGILSMSEKKRMMLEEEGKLQEPVGRKPHRIFTIVGISIAASMIIVGWVLFIRYTL
ncbi:Major Facilitator Superfamily [Geosmithia morbida]|uniref:Lysosomal dipeptide transporter MFSD1 n=1 Tax=Geosmithia morbida TaxID=1094350 RepID=A0A9P4Z3U2_9HYPO|nr:Major Facilitator Superfamily [Geosmithia morbida]KAF4126952.1 Major Facilitator Superfamily [Geosmithia morbida]